MCSISSPVRKRGNYEVTVGISGLKKPGFANSAPICPHAGNEFRTEKDVRMHARKLTIEGTTYDVFQAQHDGRPCPFYCESFDVDPSERTSYLYTFVS